MELFKAMAGVNIVYIAYRGTPQAVTDLIGGQVQLMMAPPRSRRAACDVGQIEVPGGYHA